MINILDQHIYKLTQEESFFQKEILSRTTAAVIFYAATAEAVARVAYALFNVAVYVCTEPFRLAAKTVQLIRDPKFTKAQFKEEALASLKVVLPSVGKAITCTAAIFLSPIIGLFSPRAMIRFHIDCGLASKPNQQKRPPKPVEYKTGGGLTAGIQKNIHDKFLSFHLDQEVREQLQEYGVKSPQNVVLHGPEMSQNKKAAEYIAKQLNKNLVDFTNDTLEDDGILAKLLGKKTNNKATDIAYVTITDSSKDSLKKIMKNLEKQKIPYILSSKTALPIDLIQIENPLPNDEARDELFKQGFKLAPIEEGFDYAQVVANTAGFKVKQIEEIIQASKTKAFTNKNAITLASALEIIEDIKKKKIAIPAAQSDFVGMEELHEKFDLYLEVLKSPSTAKEYDVTLPAGILLHGAPGCGKTYAAKHLCSYAKSQGVTLNFQEIKGSDVASKWKGEGIKKIRAKFEDAKKNAPVLLFIDECEGLFPSREKLQDTLSPERTQELDEALQMIEQAKEHNIIVVGATNHISTIDSAILRTGRFDYTFEVKPPNEATRLKMFEAKLKSKKCVPDLDLAQLAKETEGFTASDIHTTVNDAALVGWKTKTALTADILLESIETVKGKKASTTQGKDDSTKQPPIMQDLKKGLDAVRQLVGNLDGLNPQVANANNIN